MLQSAILMLVMDICSRFDGNPNSIYPFINHLGNFLIFLLNTILPSLWLLYVHDQIFNEEEKTKQLFYPLIVINVINAFLAVMTQFFGWFYYIDSDNIYHRGPFFLLSASIIFVFMLVAFILTIVNHNKLKKKQYYALIFFGVPPTSCIILQVAFYGISIILNSIVLSILILFLNLQNHNIYMDHLTGVNNRKKLDIYLNKKISASTEHKTFSSIMIDLDKFKYINDTFGHDEGDKALQIFAELLQSCVAPNDFIARLGGDEFCIVLDVYDSFALEEVVYRINSCIKKYNESSDRPYEIDFSMGYALYDYHSSMKVEEFKKQIDILMYENKQKNKELSMKFS
jgi:diguanylate cyclase (GGDEF)-like protein